MPKATKLHAKGKPVAIQKAFVQEGNTNTEANPEDTARQFQLELCWCIQQLEKTLNEKKGTEKQLTEAWKVVAVLKNNNQPTIRKRQLMRTHFGDYRAKMLSEEKKLLKMASKIKISEAPVPPKATFLRKSAYQTTGDESFRFNFSLQPDQIDNGTPNPDKTPDKTENKPETTNNFKFSFSNSEFKFNFNNES